MFTVKQDKSAGSHDLLEFGKRSPISEPPYDHLNQPRSLLTAGSGFTNRGYLSTSEDGAEF